MDIFVGLVCKVMSEKKTNTISFIVVVAHHLFKLVELRYCCPQNLGRSNKNKNVATFNVLLFYRYILLKNLTITRVGSWKHNDKQNVRHLFRILNPTHGVLMGKI